MDLQEGGGALPFSIRASTDGGVEYGDVLHHMFAVIDNNTVITGSFNLSLSATHTNDETLLGSTHRGLLRISPGNWVAFGRALNWESHRTSNANSTVSGSAAGMG